MRMWNDTRNTIFMVTHDVDEAILLSDRIALMTNGPGARLAECIDVPIARPRSREALLETPEYIRLRTHILHFLLRGSAQPQEPSLALPATRSSRRLAATSAPSAPPVS
jgi:nitrate/nitrite transport system ATP-binding protein